MGGILSQVHIYEFKSFNTHKPAPRCVCYTVQGHCHNTTCYERTYRPFSMHFNQMATFWLVIVSRQKFAKICNNLPAWLGWNIYSHLYSVLEFYLTFYVKTRAMSSFAVMVWHNYDVKNCLVADSFIGF